MFPDMGEGFDGDPQADRLQDGHHAQIDGQHMADGREDASDDHDFMWADLAEIIDRDLAGGADEGNDAPPALEVESGPHLPSVVGGDGIDDAVEALVAPGRWGCFTISVKQPSKGGSTYGGYEGSCPFHAKNRRTGCKTFHRIRGPTQADREDALLRCKHWCAQATSCDRQWQHVFCTSCEPCPPAEVVEANIIIEGPDPHSVIPDDEFHSKGGGTKRPRGSGASSSGGDSDAGRPRGRGRGRGRGGRSAAAAAVQAQP